MATGAVDANVVIGLARGDLINGAAEKGVVSVQANAGRFPTELAIDAANQAASRAVDRIQSYQPVTGTIMNSIGNGAIVLAQPARHTTPAAHAASTLSIRTILPVGRNMFRPWRGTLSGCFSTDRA